MLRLILFIPSLFLAILLVPYLYLISPPTLPKVDLDEWWGEECMKGNVTDEIKPFKVEFSKSMIKDIRDRLTSTPSFMPPLEGVGFEYGTNSNELEQWLKYWEQKYPFGKRENFLNKYPQFKTNIQGLDIHFIRVTPKVPSGVEVVPLLLLHGWPGSVREFYEAIPFLTAVNKTRNFAMEVIVPSLPGFGFSSAAVRPGLGLDKIAVLYRNLMHRLGFKKYYVQGGDYGAQVVKEMATFFPKEILGHHSNFPVLLAPTIFQESLRAFVYPTSDADSSVQNGTLSILSSVFSIVLEELGYVHLQSTRPDSIGVALGDSPAALAAYVLEKFSTWTRIQHQSLPDGGLTQRFTKDQLLDNIMIYYITNSMTSAMRLYAETFSTRYVSLRLDEIPTPVPTITIQPRYEIYPSSLPALKIKYPNLIRHTELDNAGHFVAFEVPEIFAKNIGQAIEDFRQWHKENSYIV